MVGEAVLLEATLENLTKAPMLLDSVAFQAQPPFQALQIGGHSAPSFEEGEGAGAGASGSSSGGGPLAGYLASLPLLPPSGGAHSFLFRLERAARPPGGGSPGRDGGGGVEARAMGKLDIRWRGPMGEVRLASGWPQLPVWAPDLGAPSTSLLEERKKAALLFL